ncbi:PREDICTED: pre-mRNA-splicing factor 38B-like [Amphimedon queenslandica]|uniref:Pre-mRNA-splicing factor 38 n=1 Tax=Amphimedon queenslandica TaxID=400682 RepID=A0A1X7VQS4_AMPQE|nr:PREDICTED: pre-mRNA-splicing factor 38B-like [Amphimedon queenslandica]|eukprot:XP_011406551.1 PREDICTED: pre-mRNA-splicing factor 38B-like [Amphimedon queenslandica]
MEDEEGSYEGEGSQGAGSVGGSGQYVKKHSNTLPLFGNKETMNINNMIITNILQSRYFKIELYEKKTFHEVVDEIFYRVEHLEPWEKNSRKLSGQVGMCAGVRGVAAGGIVSTPFCLLYKLFTLKLTRKQVKVMLNHVDSPYIRGLGFMYIRYCQPPNNFLDWFSPYLEDEEEIDLKAGGGYPVTIGVMCHMMLTKMEWFGTMFPRISVNVQKDIHDKIKLIESKSNRNAEGSTENSRGRGTEMSPENGTSQIRSSKSPRRRSHSPRRRSPSPRRRSRSPRRRSRSPKRRSRSPRRRSRSPRRRSRSPRRRSRSPRKRSKSPRRKRHSRSPRRRSRSPRRRSRSPRKRSRSPRKRSKSPRKRSKSPRKRSKSPRKRSRSRSRERNHK